MEVSKGYFTPNCNLIFGRVLNGEVKSLRNLVFTIMVQISQSSQFENKSTIHSSTVCPS